MSAEEAVTNALQTPMAQNAAAAADADKLLAELEAGDAATLNKTSNTDTNGTSDSNADKISEDKKDNEADKDHRHPDRKHDSRDRDDRKRDRSPRRDDRDRRGGRGGRGGGRGGRGDYKKNIKSVLTREEPSSDPVAIRKQVEFYFSDSNLPMDNFLFTQVGGSENKAVELDTIRSFKRMRHFEPLEAIVDALKDSKLVNVVEEDGVKKIQRKEPLPESNDDGPVDRNGKSDAVRVYEDKAMPRSVYVKGFGEEKPSTQFDIEAWFAQFGTTNAVRLRRSEDKIFKSSVFAEFETEEQAQKFLELDPKPKYNDKDLQIMSKKEYCDKKVEDIKAGKIRPSEDRPRGGHRGRGGKSNDRRGGRKDRGEDDRDWRTRRDEDRKNGFKDDKRKAGDRGDRRERRKSVEKDVRGIPVVKTDDAAKAKDDAIAQAKAAVEAEKKKDQEGADAPAVPKTDAGESKKREREEDGATQEPATKKVDAKTAA